MATVKIDTAVDAAAFSAFFEVFQRFSAGVDGQAAAWGKVAAAGGAARGTVEDAARSVRKLADNMDEILKRTNQFEDKTSKVSRMWTNLSRGTKNTAGHIKEATESLLKWAGIAGLVSGVAGFGGGHLILSLGRDVAANRSTALGLGTTYGGLAATRLAYERYGDGTALLGHIVDAQGDPARRLPFGALGMGARDFEGRDTAAVAADVMRRAKDVLDRVPDDMLGARLRVTHLDEFFTLDDARRIKHDSRAEVYAQAGSIARNRDDLGLSPKVQRQWQDFTTQMSRAGMTIETIFVNRLVALEPGLLALSDAATKIAASLLAKDGPVDQWLGELDTGLKWLADEIDKPEFQAEVRDFFAGLVDLGKSAWGLAKGAAGLLHWFAKLTGDSVVNSADAATLDTSVLGAGPATALPPATVNEGGRRGFSGRTRSLPPMTGGAVRAQRGGRGSWWTDDRIRHAYKVLTDGGLTPLEAQGQIARMAYVEAGSGPTAANGIGGGHFGIFQADRSRQRDFGGSADFDAQLQGIVKEKRTSEEYSHRIGVAAKDDYGAALAASAFERGEGYNVGSNRGTGRDNFTNRTMAAIPEVRRIVTPTTVTVNKNTGGNPSMTAALAAAPQ